MEEVVHWNTPPNSLVVTEPAWRVFFQLRHLWVNETMNKYSK